MSAERNHKPCKTGVETQTNNVQAPEDHSIGVPSHTVVVSILGVAAKAKLTQDGQMAATRNQAIKLQAIFVGLQHEHAPPKH